MASTFSSDDAEVVAAFVSETASRGLQDHEDSAAPTSPETSVRVDVALLDDLMNLVGELVLSRNQMLQHASRLGGGALIASTQRLNLITSELQEGVMRTRMQPIGILWSKFPRLVRTLAVACGKQIRLEMVGQDTAVDRAILEAVREPLTHALENAIDHGVEKPARRQAQGKAAEGRVRLRAFHQSGQVHIELADDGSGIDPERVKQKAVSRGLLPLHEAERLSARDAINLVFLPGFSTADQISTISGRGVGMDVVKDNIEKIGGAVELSSEVGVGTTLRLMIPLTLAIIPALIVRSGNERYAVPRVNILELLHLEGPALAASVTLVKGQAVCRLRGQLVPLIDLAMAFGADTRALTSRERLHIVVLQAEGTTFGIAVEGICDAEEVVVKPLGSAFKDLCVFSGATIMGDGAVALILDVSGFARYVGLVGASASVRTPAAKPSSAGVAAEEAVRLVVCEVGDGIRAAIPMAAVDRLEHMAEHARERLGAIEVVQYRSQILPLVPLRELWPLCAQDGIGDGARIVIHRHRGEAYGLVVQRILDVVPAAPVWDETAKRRGIAGAAILAGKVTEVVDVAQAIAALIHERTPCGARAPAEVSSS